MAAKHQNIKGITLMIMNAISLAALYAVMKCVTVSIPSNHAVFLYKLIILIFILPWIFYKDGLKAIYTPNFFLHIYRSIFSTTGSLCLMYSLNDLKLLDITVLTHLEQMLWLVIGSVFFHEKLSVYRVLAIILGFVGGFVIVRPELIHNLLFAENIATPEFNKAYVFVAITIICWSINSSLVKVLGNRKASNKAQLFYVMSFATLFSYCVAFIEWERFEILELGLYYPNGLQSIMSLNIEIWQIGAVSVASLFYLIHNVCFFNALKYGEMTVIAPFAYFKLIFAGMLGYIIFQESPAMPLSYLGYVFITAAGLLLIFNQYKEVKMKRYALISNEELT